MDDSRYLGVAVPETVDFSRPLADLGKDVFRCMSDASSRRFMEKTVVQWAEANERKRKDRRRLLLDEGLLLDSIPPTDVTIDRLHVEDLEGVVALPRHLRNASEATKQKWCECIGLNRPDRIRNLVNRYADGSRLQDGGYLFRLSLCVRRPPELAVGRLLPVPTDRELTSHECVVIAAAIHDAIPSVAQINPWKDQLNRVTPYELLIESVKDLVAGGAVSSTNIKDRPKLEFWRTPAQLAAIKLAVGRALDAVAMENGKSRGVEQTAGPLVVTEGCQDEGQSNKRSKRRRWQDVAKEMTSDISKLFSDGRLRTMEELGKLYGCSCSTAHKAFQKDPLLKVLAKRNIGDGPLSTAAFNTETEAVSREQDPQDFMTSDDADVVLRRLVEDAPDSESRASLHETIRNLKTPDQRIDFARKASQYISEDA